MKKHVIELIKELNVKLDGHYNYYGTTDNTSEINKCAYVIRRALFRHINRRRQDSPAISACLSD